MHYLVKFEISKGEQSGNHQVVELGIFGEQTLDGALRQPTVAPALQQWQG